MSEPSITSWARIEPQGGEAPVEVAAQARLFDPLWLLTRQWQMGEFQGEDAGTPVQARVRSTTAPVTRIHLGPLPSETQTQAKPFDAMRQPLEALIEPRTMRAATVEDPRLTAFELDAGLHFLRLLAAQSTDGDYRPAFITRFCLRATDVPVDDPEARALVGAMVGRVPHARRLATALRKPNQLVADSQLSITQGDRAEIVAAASAWLTWYDEFCEEPGDVEGDAWSTDRLEYNVTLTGRLSADPMDEVNFSAFELDGGSLAWSDFDLNLSVNMGSLHDRHFAAAAQVAVPAPVSFRGAPSPRYWAMEDAAVAYGLTPVAPGDLAQLMLVEYASAYGNDWFVFPLDLKVGVVTQLDSLVVTDSFGIRTAIRPPGDREVVAPDWWMWRHDYVRYPGEAEAPRPTRALHFVPPTAGRLLEGRPVEEVHLLRDEMANVAWAVERAVEGPLELARPRDPGAQPSPVEPGANGSLRYRLATSVPDNWIPLLPVLGAGGPAGQRLRRGVMLHPDGSMRLNAAEGTILSAGSDLAVFDEEIPREGLQLARVRRFARWIDGSTWLWTAHRRRIGRGEGASGLVFDQLVRVPSSDEP